MFELPLVSVVIVSWNARAYLQECLASLDNDAYSGELEIIVVDNASSDGSVDMVRQEFPAARIILNSENYGFARANNIGIRQCKGRYIALVNSDVHVLPHCITRLVQFCENDSTVGMVGPKIIGGNGMQQYSCRGFPGLWNMFCRALALDVAFPSSRWCTGYQLPHRPDDRCTPVDILSGCFWLVRRDALEQIGLLDETFFIYGEDMDWCRRFWSSKWPIVYIPFAESIHYGGASSANAPLRFFLEMQRADTQYWIKHHSSTAVLGYIVISLLHHGVRAIGHTAKSILNSRTRSESRHKASCSIACIKWLLAFKSKQPLRPIKV